MTDSSTQEGKKPFRQLLFFLAMLVAVSAVIAAIGYAALPYLEAHYRPLIVQYIAATLPPEEKKAIYNEISKETPSLWDTVPEPLVGRIAKPGLDVYQSYAQVKTNNAGMRDNRAYLKKDPSMYRIVCLGDSFVFGEAGKQEDRWCDQLQQWFRDTNTLLDGKPVETLALGLSSWTMLQEATYLTSRISDYDPDLIIVLTVSNDITTDAGVTGSGFLTADFSNSQRQWGNGLITNSAGAEFGLQRYTALYYDLAPAAEALWQTGMTAMKRLGDIQKKRNGKILYSVLNEGGNQLTYFENTYRDQFAKAGMDAPLFTVTYLRGADTMLLHDSHPNREGHALLTSQYLHAMKKTGILVDNSDKLPPLKAELEPLLNTPADNKMLQVHRQASLKRIPNKLDFANMSADQSMGLLGGIFPDRAEPTTKPWASTQAGFLLKRSGDSPNRLSLIIEIPDKPELFPLETTLAIDGNPVKNFTFLQGEKVSLTVEIPSGLTDKPALEILLTSNHYFTGIDDHRMKVFRLVSAGWE